MAKTPGPSASPCTMVWTFARGPRTLEVRREETCDGALLVVVGGDAPGSTAFLDMAALVRRSGTQAERSAAACLTARKSTLPVPSVGIDSTMCRSSRLGIQSFGSSHRDSRSQTSCAGVSGSV